MTAAQRYQAALKARIARGLQACAEEAAAAAQSLAPVQSGVLKSSIHTQSEALSASVYADAPYALCVELGTSRQRPQPFLRPAFMQARQALERHFQ